MIVFYTVRSIDFWFLFCCKQPSVREKPLPQVRELYQGGQRYWHVLGHTGIFLLLVFVMEIWEIAKLFWDVFRKFYLDEEKIFL